jgi:transposase, IS5 family
METYLRLMFLKFWYRLGYEVLCREVADSISWQRFCRIPLGVRVPHPTTLMKISTRCGDDGVAALNEALLVKLRLPRASCCAPTRCAPTPRW